MWAAPEKTAQQLAATRRNARRSPMALAAAAQEVDVRLVGSVGPSPGAVIQQLMVTAEGQLGFALKECGTNLRGNTEPEATWEWARRHDPGAPAGHIRLRLQDAEQVNKVYEKLNGRAIQLGGDLVTIEISNDLQLAKGSKNARGR